MIISMTLAQAEGLAEFLNRKYEERRTAHRRDGKRYSMTRFSKDLGIAQSTLSRLMVLGPKGKPVEAMDAWILLALYDAFGDELMQALRGDVAQVHARKMKGD